MKRYSLIRELIPLFRPNDASSVPVQFHGWVRSIRKQKHVTFMVVSDGSVPKGIQVVVDNPKVNMPPGLSVGSSVSVQGILSENRGSVEVQVGDSECIRMDGACDESEKYYPLSKPNLEYKFLRTIPHLRCRTSTFGSITRIRNDMTMSIHKYLQGVGLYQIHAPVITGSDSEGAGEQFKVTTDQDRFFGSSPSYLTVSSQLHAEAFATCMLPGVYTFGPTFRAENSNTTRHLAEFWMVEPELGYASLPDILALSEGMVRHVAESVLSNFEQDLLLLDEHCEYQYPGRVASLVGGPYAVLSYNEAIRTLQRCPHSFTTPVCWQAGLATEHEKYLANEFVKGPVFVTDYPASIKPFYMKPSVDSSDTVAAMDLLLPHVGEVAGGSERIHDYHMLLAKLGDQASAYDWYLDLRRFGTIPHAGFGLGFDRLVQYICGLSNIRDTIPFPRHPGELLL